MCFDFIQRVWFQARRTQLCSADGHEILEFDCGVVVIITIVGHNTGHDRQGLHISIGIGCLPLVITQMRITIQIHAKTIANCGNVGCARALHHWFASLWR